MLEKVVICFRDLFSVLQTARLYPDWHPEFKKNIEKAYNSLQEVLNERDKLVIGIVGEELAFEKEIFFELSKILKPMIIYLKERGVERIEFLRGVQKEELSQFVSFLITPKDEIKLDPQEHLSLLGVKNITVGKIKVLAGIEASAEKKVVKAVSYLSTYEESVDKISYSLDQVLNSEDLDRMSLKLSVNNIMENLSGRYQDFLNLATIKRFDVKTFLHTVNVSILAMFFSSKVGFSKEETQEIGTAALFHDIGKLYISRKIIRKPDKLTEQEFDKIKNHAILGTEILLKYTDSLGILPVVVCFEHHLRYDLKGYPKTPFLKKLHIASLIVAICDVYDALSQRRDYKSDYPPQMIHSLMIRERGEAFEPNLLDRFFKVMGVWPIGTIVALSDGRVAVVREENEEDIYAPKVEVVWPQDKKENLDLKAVKEYNKIEHSLNPLKEGKDYLPLIYGSGNSLTSP